MLAEKYLKLALNEAKKGRGFCAPNPAVGAVIVKNQQIIATGFHAAFGLPHAEAMALSQLTMAEAAGAYLYVTLEPCCHWGKTPPCVDLIIEKGISKVCYGLTDPNPQMQGKSINLLQQHGIECELVELTDVKDFYQSYCYWQQSQKPWVTAKIAVSLDGKIAQQNNVPYPITDVAAQQYTHERRKHSDGLLTTVKTIISDDPKLNVRLAAKTISKPLFVVDRNLQLPLTTKILTTAKTITLFYDQALSESNKLQQYLANKITCIPISVQDDLLNMQEVLTSLGKMGIHDLWVEAGGKLTEHLIQQQLLQQLLIYIAPKTLGKNAMSAFTQAFDLTASSIQSKMFGDDVLIKVEF